MAYTLSSLLLYCFAFGQTAALTDGPYVFIENGQLVQKAILEGAVVTEMLEPGTYDTVYAPSASVFKEVEKIAAFSDVHGQFDLLVEILQNNGIIDQQMRWAFGSGHLVIVGDLFDRGGKVTETLWLIYNLELEAKKAGGRVHYLLGNHEYMILHSDLRYLHEKYVTTSNLLEMSYDDMFGPSTVLGRWLRSKPTLIKINDQVFVHGGVSMEFILEAGVNLDSINALMRESIDRPKETLKATGFYTTYYGKTGPIWYRGYFYDELPPETIDAILNKLQSEQVIVGHCSNETVVALHDKRIFGVDSSIKKGSYGEVLFWIADTFYRGTKDGGRVGFD